MSCECLKVLFVDDCFDAGGDRQRKAAIELVDTQLDNVVVSMFTPSDLLSSEFSENRPDHLNIIFLDFKFTSGSSGGFHKGTECESLLRAIYPDTPIYFLSQIVSSRKEDGRHGSFERSVSANFLSHPEWVLDALKGHALISEAFSHADKNRLLSALGCTDEFVQDDLIDSLPVSVKQALLSEQTRDFEHLIGESGEQVDHIGPKVMIMRWFIDKFFRLPGFLLSKSDAATMLGLREECFEEDIFKDALYKGVFSQSLPQRWWSGLIKETLIGLAGENMLSSDSFFKSSAEILGVSEDCHARCVCCGEKWPEAMGRDVSTSQSELHPVHYRCSMEDRFVEQSPYFSAPRLFGQDSED